ncbi:MAG: SDR family oxidoreductase [Gemmatimonadetes bacterium]|nr:SDR family oxidoreductase [Gemmatimonadota bacterium]
MGPVNRVVVVTGASGGVGRATARHFARSGDRVALLARGGAGLEGARQDVEALGVRGLAIPVDVSDAEAVDAAAWLVEEELGPIDVWINNAMATVFSPSWDMEPDEFRRATEVTYLGGVWGTLAALRRMRPRDRGSIVNVGSALAYRSIPLQSAYCGAKFALRGFTDSVRCELIHEESGVRLTMVHLPGLNTPQFDWCRAKVTKKPQPVPPIYQPEVAARAIEWASRNDRREVWVGWPTYKTILGNKIAPRLLDRYLAHEAWEGQLTDEPLEGEREGNLFEPLDDTRDRGARGSFDRRSRSRSPVLQASLHPGWLAAGAAALGAASLWLLRRHD